MTSHLLHEIADQLTAASHIACEALSEMYQSGRDTLSDADAKKCCTLWYIIEWVGSMNLDLWNIDDPAAAATQSKGVPPVTGTWTGPDDMKARLAANTFAGTLRDTPEIPLSHDVMDWILGLVIQNSGAGTSGPISPILKAAGDKLVAIGLSLKKNVKSLSGSAQYGSEEIIYNLRDIVRVIEEFIRH